MIDLGKWLSEEYRISEPLTPMGAEEIESELPPDGEQPFGGVVPDGSCPGDSERSVEDDEIREDNGPQAR